MRRSLFSLAAFSPALAGAITIAIQPLDQGAGGVGGSGLTPAQMAVLGTAASQWEQSLPSYQDGITLGGVTVHVGAFGFDGAGGTYAETTVLDTTFEAGYFLATTASIQFDIHDLPSLEAAALLQVVVQHELAHALGFGTLWEFNGLASSGTGRYYGPAGVAAYRTGFSPAASYVPVELGGGPATRDLHWNEVDNGTGLTGLVDAQGRDFGHDLMSGWTGPDPARIFLSNTSLRSFEDLGFVVVPEPSVTFLLVAAPLGLLIGWRPGRSVGDASARVTYSMAATGSYYGVRDCTRCRPRPQGGGACLTRRARPRPPLVSRWHETCLTGGRRFLRKIPLFLCRTVDTTTPKVRLPLLPP